MLMAYPHFPNILLPTAAEKLCTHVLDFAKPNPLHTLILDVGLVVSVSYHYLSQSRQLIFSLPPEHACWEEDEIGL